VRREVVILQRALAREQQVVHFPELSLQVGRLSGQRGMQGMRWISVRGKLRKA
jgi:hypothetical protein